MNITPETKRKFIESFGSVSTAFENNAQQKGFWSDNSTVGEKIALMHQELSELLEAYRGKYKHSDKIPGFSEAEEELADLIIRAMDFAYHYGMNLAEAVLSKHEYNVGRPFKHNKSF